MKKQLLFFISFLFICININADFMAEIAKRDRNNPIRLGEYSANVLYARNGYFHTEFREDGFSVPQIVAYQIQQDSIKLIVRIRTWDFAFRFYDWMYERDGIDQFTIDVHDYYLVELLYVNDKLETYVNRIRDINANGFIFNDAKISNNIDKVPQGTYHIYYSYSGHRINLTEGMETKIVLFTNHRTDFLADNSHATGTYDYYYNVLIEEKEFRLNGYLLDFSNKVDYRSQLLILNSED